MTATVGIKKCTLAVIRHTKLLHKKTFRVSGGDKGKKSDTAKAGKGEPWAGLTSSARVLPLRPVRWPCATQSGPDPRERYYAAPVHFVCQYPGASAATPRASMVRSP